MYVSVGGLFSKVRSEQQQEHALAVFFFPESWNLAGREGFLHWAVSYAYLYDSHTSFQKAGFSMKISTSNGLQRLCC